MKWLDLVYQLLWPCKRSFVRTWELKLNILYKCKNFLYKITTSLWNLNFSLEQKIFQTLNCGHRTPDSTFAGHIHILSVVIHHKLFGSAGIDPQVTVVTCDQALYQSLHILWVLTSIYLNCTLNSFCSLKLAHFVYSEENPSDGCLNLQMSLCFWRRCSRSFCCWESIVAACVCCPLLVGLSSPWIITGISREFTGWALTTRASAGLTWKTQITKGPSSKVRLPQV